MKDIWEQIDEEEFNEFRNRVGEYWRGSGDAWFTGMKDGMTYLIYADMKSREKLQKSTDRLTIVGIILTLIALLWAILTGFHAFQ